jgi:hypothetical protein
MTDGEGRPGSPSDEAGGPEPTASPGSGPDTGGPEPTATL